VEPGSLLKEVRIINNPDARGYVFSPAIASTAMKG